MGILPIIAEDHGHLQRLSRGTSFSKHGAFQGKKKGDHMGISQPLSLQDGAPVAKGFIKQTWSWMVMVQYVIVVIGVHYQPTGRIIRAHRGHHIAEQF